MNSMIRQYRFSSYRIVFVWLLFLLGCEQEETTPKIAVNTTSIAPAYTQGRTNAFIDCVEINNRITSISVWDRGLIDGDIISLYANGQKIIDTYTLKGPDSKKTINYSFDNNGYNYLVMYAHNEGSISPNTAAISINGVEFDLQSDLLTNGYVDIVITGFGVSCSSGSGSTTNGGSSGNGNSGGTTSTGQAMFWTKSDLGCGSISVTLNNISKTISSYYSSGAPSCDASGAATFTMAPGTYTYSASCSGGKTWSGSVTVTAGGCFKMQLVDNGAGAGGGTGATTTGQAMFWTQTDLGCGSITVTLNNSSKTISSYYSSGAPSCAASGTATFTQPPGNYNFTASCNGKRWSGSVAITAGGCYKMQLTN